MDAPLPETRSRTQVPSLVRQSIFTLSFLCLRFASFFLNFFFVIFDFEWGLNWYFGFWWWLLDLAAWACSRGRCCFHATTCSAGSLLTSSLRCIVSVADIIAWIYWCNFSLKKFGIICFFSSSSFLLLAVPAWRIVQRLVMNVLYVTRSMLKQVTYYQDSFMLLLAIGRVLGDSADFLFYFVFLYLI